MNRNRVLVPMLAIFTSALVLGCGYLIRPTDQLLAHALETSGAVLLLMASSIYAVIVIVDFIVRPAVAAARGLHNLLAPRFSARDPNELQATAYHEAGHALVAWFSPEAPAPKWATVVRSTESLGETEFEDQQDKSRHALLASIRVSLAGSAAEEIGVGEFTAGSRGDFDDATATATAMVASYGMSESLGQQVFDIDGIPGLEPEIRRKIRKNVRKILDGEKKAARALLERHRPRLDALAAELVRKKTLRRKRIAAILGERPASTASTPPQQQLAAANIS